MVEKTPQDQKSKIMIIAAEASSAQYALQIMLYWKSVKFEADIFGVGTKAMEDLGMRRIGRSEDMAVVGLVEVLKHYNELKKTFNQLVDEALKLKPDFVLLLDYPDFNLRLAETLKKKIGTTEIKVFYYISPQIWAWRQGRVHQIKKYCDKVFVILPFEKSFYDQYSVPNEFVGHPLLDDLKDEYFDVDVKNRSRQKYGITATEKVLALMPGSRKGEIERNFPTQIETARILYKMHPNIRVAVFVAPTLSKEVIQQYCDDVNFPFIFIQDEPHKMISMADYVLVASGTATLMVGLQLKPMVIMYKLNQLTGFLAKFLVRGVKYFGLVNLILNKEAVPERFQAEANPENLAKLINEMITKPEYEKQIIQDLSKLKKSLGEAGATRKVAETLMKTCQKGLS